MLTIEAERDALKEQTLKKCILQGEGTASAKALRLRQTFVHEPVKQLTCWIPCDRTEDTQGRC